MDSSMAASARNKTKPMARPWNGTGGGRQGGRERKGSKQQQEVVSVLASACAWRVRPDRVNSAAVPPHTARGPAGLRRPPAGAEPSIGDTQRTATTCAGVGRGFHRSAN